MKTVILSLIFGFISAGLFLIMLVLMVEHFIGHMPVIPVVNFVKLFFVLWAVMSLLALLYYIAPPIRNKRPNV